MTHLAPAAALCSANDLAPRASSLSHARGVDRAQVGDVARDGAAGRRAVVAQLARIAVPAALLIALPALPTILAIGLAGAVYLGVFTLAHELAHGALGLRRQRNDLALALAGACMATSGHGLRLMHLRHHAQPLSDGDLEGRSARMPAWQALLAAPALAVLLVVTAWRTASARDRRWQRVEYAALAALAITAAGAPRALQLYLAVALAAQLLAPFWAGHLPHRTPAWLLAIARRLARAGSMTMLTLVVHDDHHRRPKLPTYLLSDRTPGRYGQPARLFLRGGSDDNPAARPVG